MSTCKGLIESFFQFNSKFTWFIVDKYLPMCFFFLLEMILWHFETLYYFHDSYQNTQPAYCHQISNERVHLKDNIKRKFDIDDLNN